MTRGQSAKPIFPTLSFSANEKGAERLGQRERVASPEGMTLAAGFGDDRRVPNNQSPLNPSGPVGRAMAWHIGRGGLKRVEPKGMLKVIRARMLNYHKTHDFACVFAGLWHIFVIRTDIYRWTQIFRGAAKSYLSRRGETICRGFSLVAPKVFLSVSICVHLWLRQRIPAGGAERRAVRDRTRL